jgi:hypothetical protein
MSIDISTSTSLTDVLKTVYAPTFQNNFASEHTLWNILPSAPESDAPSGKGFVGMARISNPGGIGFRGETDKLPDPVASKQDQWTVSAKHGYGVIRLTGAVIALGKKNPAAFANTLQYEVDGAYEEFLVQMNRMAYGDGSGKLATLSAASDTLSTTVAWNVTCDNDRGVRLCRPGQVVDFYTSAGAIDQSSVASVISDVDYRNKVLVMAANDGSYKANHPRTGFSAYTIVAEAVPNAAVVVVMGTRDASYATSDTLYEMTGLEGIFDDGTLVDTFQNIDADTNRFWRANIFSNSGTNRELTEDLLIEAIQGHRAETGRMPTRAFMGQGQERKMYNLYAGDVRFSPRELMGGWNTMSIAVEGTEVKLVVDPYCPTNKIFIANEDSVEKFILEDLNWMEELELLTGYDQRTSYLAIRGNMGTRNRRSCTLLTDLTEPA